MSDSSDEDNPYVKYGTPLQELDELSIKPSSLKSSVPVFEQVVTDEEGRRRFHGAFTGGFSAGYYNTVGTKEGWKPAEFKSSRSGKSERKAFKAEDFMDEEDLGDFGIAPRTLSTKVDFTSKKKRNAIQETQKQLQEDRLTFPLGSDVIESLVVPVRSNIGVKLLRNMGWREGQGLGPHVKKKKKKKTATKPATTSKIYGCSLPRKLGESDSDDEYIPEDFKFAPKDSMPISANVKDDRHGIGYSGLDPTAALHKKVKKSSAVKAKTKSGSKLSFFGQAFGVGAYEEEDEDIYAQDSMSNYDAIMGEERNPDSTYGWTKPHAITGGNTREAIGFGETTKIFFLPARKQSKLYPKVYPAPNLPADFDPNRRLRLRTGTKRIEEMNLPKQVSNQILSPAVAPPHHLTSQDRGALLDGNKLDGVAEKSQSVFDFISFEDRQKMEAAKLKPVELGHKEESEQFKEISMEAQVDRSSPLCKPQSLKPFSNNPEKLRRYNQYEEAVKQRKKDPYSSIQSNLTEWERKHERDEFARMSQVYLHLFSNINSKFTKSSEENPEGIEVSNNPDSEPAAKMKMFGIMTHNIAEWHPDPLLCKRFNVPDPYPDSEHVGSSVPSGAKYLSFLPLPHEESTKSTEESDKARIQELKNKSGVISDTVRPPVFEKSRPFTKRRWDKEPDFVGPLDRKADDSSDANTTANEETTKEDTDKPTERPPMELFKSIFASSEEESSSEEDDDIVEATESQVPHVGIPGSLEERKSAADVFARPLPMTQDKASSQPESDESNASEMSPVRPQNNAFENKEMDEDCFGPALPPAKLSDQPSNLEAKHKSHQRHKSHSKHKKHKKHDHKWKKKKLKS